MSGNFFFCGTQLFLFGDLIQINEVINTQNCEMEAQVIMHMGFMIMQNVFLVLIT